MVFENSYPENCKNPVWDQLEHKQDLAIIASANLKHVPECELTRRNRTRCLTSFKVGDLVLVQDS